MKFGKGVWILKTDTKGVNKVFKYDGNWRSDKKHGFGIYTVMKNGRLDWKYEGFFKNNKYSGMGMFMENECKIYKGYFKKGLKHGKGKLLLCNGDRYVG